MRWPWAKKVEEREPLVVGAPRGPGDIDRLSPTWLAVETYATKEIERLRGRNESLTADAIRTAAIRGQIKALRGVLQLADGKRRGLMAPEDD